MKVALSVKYEAGHSYNEDWVKTEYFCLHCGKQQVWSEDSAGDYYCGPGVMCAACGWSWTMQGPGENMGWQAAQRLTAINGLSPETVTNKTA